MRRSRSAASRVWNSTAVDRSLATSISVLPDVGEVGIDHHLHQLRELHLGLPTEELARLRHVAAEVVDLRRTEVARIDLDVAVPVEIEVAERVVEEVAHGVRLTGRDHEVVGALLLEHEPHRLDVITGEAPVALGV